MTENRKPGLSTFKVFGKLIELELRDLRQFIEEITLFFETKILEIEDSYQFALKDVNPEEKDYIEDLFVDDFHKYGKIFPKQYYNPILLSLFGSFENWLKRLCELEGSRSFSQVDVTDLSGNNYIEKSRKYLKLVSELDLSDADLLWQKISQIQKIRNLIAHNESNIWIHKNNDLNKQELYTLISKDDRIEFNSYNGDFYIKDKAFLVEIIQLVNDYLNILIDKLNQRKVIARNTTMPFNNETWGHEKSEHLIESAISCLNVIDEFEKRTDIHRESDLKINIFGNIESLLWDATKIYSFFGDSKWSADDRELIIKERRNGFEQIKIKYKK